MKLKHQVAIVTGSGRGIGRGIAEVFSREGAKVVIATRTVEEGKAVEHNIRQSGERHFLYKQTLLLKVASNKWLNRRLKNTEKIDILVNNAGITLFKPLLEATVEDWEHVINIDLRGTFLCSKYVLPEMMKQQKGISSISLQTMPSRRFRTQRFTLLRRPELTE